MALVITKKTRTILFIILGVLVVGGGGFLFWRINQKETVAPEDSEASPSCYTGEELGGNFCGRYGNEPCTASCYCGSYDDGATIPWWKPAASSKCEVVKPPSTDDDETCTCDCGTDKKPSVNGSCKWETVCVPTYGPCGCYGWGDENGACFKVTYNPNGGTCTRTEYMPQKKDTITPSCTRTGYTISSFTKVSGTGTLNSSTGVLTNVSSVVVIKVNWKIISATKYTLSYSAGTGGSINGESSQTVVKGEDGSSVTAVPNDGYKFVKWSDNSTSNPRTDTNVTKNISITASFEQLPANQYTLTYLADDSGSIDGNAIQTVEEGEEGTVVTAVANSGYKFVKWSDNSTSNPRTDTNVTKNISVTASFEQLPANQFTLTYIAGENGTLTGDTTQVVEEGEDGSSVTAVPNDGYKFIEWSDNSTSNPRTDTNVIESLLITALFVGEESDVVIVDNTVPQTGILDTVLGKISVGVSFIFLGGLVSQYSRFNYLLNSITEKHRFRQEIRKEKKVVKRRKKLENRFK